jgi:hypothetical protein
MKITLSPRSTSDKSTTHARGPLTKVIRFRWPWISRAAAGMPCPLFNHRSGLNWNKMSYNHISRKLVLAVPHTRLRPTGTSSG